VSVEVVLILYTWATRYSPRSLIMVLMLYKTLHQLLYSILFYSHIYIRRHSQ